MDAVSFVGVSSGRRSYRTEALDLGLNVAERFLDKVFANEECIIRDLKHRKRRWSKALKIFRRFKIYLRHIQSPKGSEIHIKGDHYAIEFVKVPIFAYFPAFKLFERRIFGVVQMYLGELCYGVFALVRRETLLQYSRPCFRIRIAYLPQTDTGILDVIIEYLQMTAGWRERLGQAFDQEKSVEFGLRCFVHFR